MEVCPTFTTTTNAENTHRAAISLNNIGVALLRRRCHHAGMMTLRDSVAAMNLVCRLVKQEQGQRCDEDDNDSDGQGEGDCPPTSPADVDLMLRQADQRLARSHQEHPNASRSTTTTPTPTCRYPNPQDEAKLVTFDVCDDFLNDEASLEVSCDINSSIILQNYALAHRIRAEQEHDIALQQRLRTIAMRLFQFSYSVLVGSIRGEAEQELDRVVSTLVLVLQNLIDISLLLNLDTQEFTCQLHKVKSSVQDWTPEDCMVVAAAAA